MWAIIGDWKIQLPEKSDFTKLFILKCFKMCAPASNTALCVIFIYKVFGGCHRLLSFVNKAGNFAQMGQCIIGDVAPLGLQGSLSNCKQKLSIFSSIFFLCRFPSSKKSPTKTSQKHILPSYKKHYTTDILAIFPMFSQSVVMVNKDLICKPLWL